MLFQAKLIMTKLDKQFIKKLINVSDPKIYSLTK